MNRNIMRPILILCVIISQIVLSCKEDDLSNDCKSRYYYYSSEKIYLNEIPNQGTVSFYDTLTTDEIYQIFKQYPDTYILSIPSNSRGAIISVVSESCEETDFILSNIRLNPKVSNCSKFLISSEGYSLGIYDVFVCKMKISSNENELEKLIEKTKTQLLKADSLKRHYLIKADKNSKGDALDMANEFF